MAGLVLRHIEVLRDVLDGPDLLQHRENGLVRAAVRRPPEGGDTSRNCRIRIGARAARQSDRGGARILLVVGMQNEQQIQRLRGRRVDLVRLAGNREEHIQQVRAVVQVVTRINERLALRMLVRCRRDRRNLGDDAVSENLTMARIIDIHRVMVERGHRGDHSGHHGHRVCVVMKAVEEPQQRLVDHRVMTDVGGEVIQLLGARQFAVQHQVGDFHERALFRQLLHREAAVQQYAFIAVNVRDPAFGRGRGTESRVEGEYAQILVDRGNVDDGGTDSAIANGQLRFAIAGSIDQFELFVGHSGEAFRKDGLVGVREIGL